MENDWTGINENDLDMYLTTPPDELYKDNYDYENDRTSGWEKFNIREEELVHGF